MRNQYTSLSISQKGFTLLEILLVVVAISILSSIVIIAINPQRQLDQARQVENEANKTTIQKALSQYYVNNRTYPQIAEFEGYRESVIPDRMEWVTVQ